MAKLEIRLNEQGKEKQGKRGHLPPLQFSDYDILIDGQEPSLMRGFSLNMSTETFNECTITFNVDGLEVDAEALAALQAVAKVDKPAITIDGETFDEITKKGRIHEYGKTAAEAKRIDRKMLDAVKNAPVQIIEGDLYRANKIKDDLLSIIDELLKYKFTDEVGHPLHHALPFQQLAEIANYYIDTDRYFARDGSKIIESLKGYDKAETHEVKDFKINLDLTNEDLTRRQDKLKAISAGEEVKLYLVVEEEGVEKKHIPIVPTEKNEWIGTPDITIKSGALKDIKNKTNLDYAIEVS